MNQMTDRQEAFIRKLAEERAAEVTINPSWTTREASIEIDRLLKIKPPVKAPAAQAPRAGVTQDGMYRTPDGTIFKVQFNKASGDGRRCYAKELIIDTDAVRDEDGHIVEAAKVRFEYKSGAVLRLQADWKMTMEQAQAFGALYGTCVRCGRTLTREESIARSMGPICAGYFA